MANVQNKSSNTLGEWGGLLVVGILLVGGWYGVAYLLPDGWRLKYAVRYMTSYTQVTVQDRPTNCDFFHAPIGDKSCHYEKAISRVKWAKSTTGQPIMSYDEGKTWSFGDPPPNVKLPTEFVFVEWNKVEDP
jgi:hypothetical protein